MAIIITIITIISIITTTKVSQEITDIGKIFPNCQTEGDSGPVWGLGLRSLALQVTLMMSGDVGDADDVCSNQLLIVIMTSRPESSKTAGTFT